MGTRPDPRVADAVGPSAFVVTAGFLDEIVKVVRRQTGFELLHYKRPLVHRALVARMTAVGSTNGAAYVAHLAAHRAENDLLIDELLVRVSGFFRDEGAFSALASSVAGHLAARSRDDGVRAWVAACAQGEEAYSIAMILLEERETAARRGPLALFATDMSEDALRTARAGAYDAQTLLAVVSEPRLARFFDRSEGSFVASPALRARIVFARHDLVADAPFRRLDLVSCRNVLIYLQPEFQAHVFRRFHHALAADGLLFLGSSESADEDLFAPVDVAARIYRRRPIVDRPSWHVPVRPRPAVEIGLRPGDLPEIFEKLGLAMCVVGDDFRIRALSDSARVRLGLELDGALPAEIATAAETAHRTASTVEIVLERLGRRMVARVAPGGRGFDTGSVVVLLLEVTSLRSPSSKRKTNRWFATRRRRRILEATTRGGK